MTNPSSQRAARRGDEAGALGGFSLNPELMRDIFSQAKPVGQHQHLASLNLGFGFLYYALVRTLRPRHVLVIGSDHGFCTICLALGVKDNRRGRVSFVEPVLAWSAQSRTPTLGRVNHWHPPEKVAAFFARFGVREQVTHHRMVCAEFFHRYDELALPEIDLALVDGQRAASEVSFDFGEVLRRSRKNTYILLHDRSVILRKTPRPTSVLRWLKALTRNPELFELIKFPFAKGVALVRVKRGSAWKQFGAGYPPALPRGKTAPKTNPKRGAP